MYSDVSGSRSLRSAIGSKSTIGLELGMYALRAGGHHPAESDKAITRKLRAFIGFALL